VSSTSTADIDWGPSAEHQTQAPPLVPDQGEKRPSDSPQLIFSSHTGPTYLFSEHVTGSLSSGMDEAGREIFETSSAQVVERQLFGEVEKVEDGDCLVIFHQQDEIIGRRMSRERLRSIGADFEGARILLIVENRGNGVYSRVENIGKIAPPKWREVLENYDLKVFTELKNRARKKPSF
jgi:hypothetical protein